MTPRPAYLISHTHWDREWYRTFQQFRLDLVRTIDGVLDAIEHAPHFKHFMLDGQTIVLDDYLAMRPRDEERLRRHVAAGNLAVGPWYCHPDLFLVSGESIVRNLLLGLSMARDYGRAMMVGYIPDQFGHTGQMPQIFRGFGIESAVLWRGVNARETRNETWWDAPDGSRVFLEFLPQGYGNAQRLPLDPPALATRLRQLCDLLAPGATGPGVLLMNGSDHLPVQAALPAALVEANKLLGDAWRVEQTSLEDAVAALRESGHPEGVQRGELRSPATSHLLPGVLSTRIPIKQRNARVQTLLEREAEPFAAWASLFGLPYPLGELWEAWRLLLRNQPHDSICGCSIDQVHREMVTRFDEAEQIGEALVDRALGHLAAAVDTRPEGDVTPHTVPLVVFNPAGIARTTAVEIALQLPGVAAGYELLDARGRAVPHHWRGTQGEPSTVMEIPRDSIPAPAVMFAQLEGNRVMGLGLQELTMEAGEQALQVGVTVGETGIMSREELEQRITEAHRRVVETDPLPIMLHVHRNARHELRFLARDLPPYGYATYWLRPRDATYLGAEDEQIAAAEAPPPEQDGPDECAIENAHLRVEADERTGAVTLTDKRTGIAYGPCNLFVDGGDVGDSYTYNPPATDTIVDRPAAPPRIERAGDEVGAQLRIVQDLVVPARAAEERDRRADETATLRIASTLRLTADNPRVDITTTVDNTAEDHRLRVCFHAPFAAGHVHAEGAYDVVERPVGLVGVDGAASEDPVPDAPQHGFVVVHEGERGLLVAAPGLPEYAAMPRDGGTTIELTLLRCVGWLSREDLTTRRGGAGPMLPTPEAQCPGRHSFSYSIIPLAGRWEESVGEARATGLPPRTRAESLHDGTLPPTASFLTLDAPGVQVSAIKGAEDGRGLVVRLYNPLDRTASGILRLLRPVAGVERLTLDERHVDTLHDGDARRDVALALGPHKIETLRLLFS